MSKESQKKKSGKALTRILKWVAVIIPILLIVGFFGIGAIVAAKTTTPERQFSDSITPASVNLPFQDVTLTARGSDLKIAGWYIPNEGKKQAIILVHGRNQSRTSELYGLFIDLAATIQKAGYNIMMIDLRGHGQSANAHWSFGIKERLDVEAAADWLKNQGIKPGNIGVLGISLGAASCIGAAADDQDIGAVVSDSCFATLYPILQSQSGLPGIILTSGLLMTRLMYGYDLTASRPVDEIGRIAPRPVLIIHSTSDQIIPEVNAEQLHAADPTAETWIVTGPEHARSYNADPATYSQKVISFFNRSFGN